MSLRNSVQIHTLACDLGLKPSRDPVSTILRYCERRTDRLLTGSQACKTLTELLMVMADKLQTHFEIVRSDQDVERVREKYLRRGERAFSRLNDELADDVFGITFRRTAKKDWERLYVSVIDGRGSKGHRTYFTKWHELGHLLVLTDKIRLSFRRTHMPQQFGLDTADPEELMVDLVAGAIGFLPRIVRRHSAGRPSFEKFDRLRTKLCPEASRTAATKGFAQAWPTPCLLVKAKESFSRGEERWLAQPSLGLGGEPTPVLRAVHIRANAAARSIDLRIFRNMRVPVRSIIHQVSAEQSLGPRTNIEDMSWWEASQGTQLPQRKVLVQARSVSGEVEAMLTPA